MSAVAQPSCEIDPESFRAIADLAYRVSGLTLVEEKKSMVQSRLRHRLRDLRMPDFPSYASFLMSDDGAAERDHLISALTTNVTHFFREAHHFESLKSLLRTKRPNLEAGGSLRIWSAGCSNGQEAFSAAMTVLEAIPQADQFDIRILATDIDREVVQFAREGLYSSLLMGGVPHELVDRHFEKVGTGQGETTYRAKAGLRRLIKFNILNLLTDWPMTRPFDAIFCRNVVIYFDSKTRDALWPRIRNALTPDGQLFLGHSERIATPEKIGFRCTGPTTYQMIPP